MASKQDNCENDNYNVEKSSTCGKQCLKETHRHEEGKIT